MEGVVVDARFWRGKRVLLTGHTGFKGAWLSLCLQGMGADVTGFALDPPTQPSFFDLVRIGGGMRDIRGDIRDLDAVRRSVAQADPEIVIHMAAQSLVRRSYEDPVETYATNVMGTAHVLECMRGAGHLRAALVVTSDKCYENRECSRGYRENDPMGGFDPYSSSKGCAELVTAAYRNSYFKEKGMALASARAGNVIGGGDWARDRLLPDAVRAFTAGQPLEIRNPRAVRPWQHVLEPLSGYLLLIERLWTEGAAMAEGWNFGPAEDDTRSVEDVVGRFAAHWGVGARWQLAQGAQPHEAHHLRLDCAKAGARLGWHRRLSLDAALGWTAEWYRAWHGGADVRGVALAQIERYTALHSEQAWP
jgi:CDP-glucose 4,6-dehydratase